MKSLKQFERYVSALFSLGRTKRLAKEADRGLTEIQQRVDRLEERLEERLAVGAKDLQDLQKVVQALQSADEAGSLRMTHMDRDAELIQTKLKKLSMWQTHHDGFAERLVQDYRRESATLQRLAQSDTAMLARMFSALSARLDIIGQNHEGTDREILPIHGPNIASLPTTAGFDLFKDNFHQRLESRVEKKDSVPHLEAYLPGVEEAWQRTGKLPVMDLGCGHGDWLALLTQRDIGCFGVDTDVAQIKIAQNAGLNARHEDALAALADQKDGSLSVISAHHLIVYLPFDAVAWVVREAMRVLAPGGQLIIETLNACNLEVVRTALAAPIPLRLLSEQALEVLFETAGFHPVDTRALNPHVNFSEVLSQPGFDEERASMIFGPQDLAILGTKPQEP